MMLRKTFLHEFAFAKNNPQWISIAKSPCHPCTVAAITSVSEFKRKFPVLIKWCMSLYDGSIAKLSNTLWSYCCWLPSGRSPCSSFCNLSNSAYLSASAVLCCCRNSLLSRWTLGSIARIAPKSPPHFLLESYEAVTIAHYLKNFQVSFPCPDRDGGCLVLLSGLSGREPNLGVYHLVIG